MECESKSDYQREDDIGFWKVFSQALSLVVPWADNFLITLMDICAQNTISTFSYILASGYFYTTTCRGKIKFKA